MNPDQNQNLIRAEQDALSPSTCVVALATGMGRIDIERWLRSAIHQSMACHESCLVIVDEPDSALVASLESLWINESQHRFGALKIVGLGAVIEDVAHADLLVITAGVFLPKGWDLRLMKAFEAEQRIGLVTAFQAGMEFATVQATGDVNAAEFWSRLDAALYCVGDRAVYDAPSVSSACIGVRRSALVEAGKGAGLRPVDMILDFENILSRLTYSGWRVCVADYLAVGLGEAKPKFSRSPDTASDSIVAQLHPLNSIVATASEWAEKLAAPLQMPGLDGRPVILHLLHSWGGGIQKWVDDFCAADAGRIHLLLQTVQVGDRGTQRMRLRIAGTQGSSLREWDLAAPIRSIEPSSLEYERALKAIIRNYSVDGLVVSSLIGHALTALDQELPTCVVLHDYLPICQNIYPYFDGECARCTVQDLARCQTQNSLNTEFKHVPARDWHALRNRHVELLLERRPQVIAPNRSVVGTLRKLDFRFEQLDIRVIPNGIPATRWGQVVSGRRTGRPLRMVVLGRLNALKGEGLLRQLLAEGREDIEIILLGCGPAGEALAQAYSLQCIPEYRPEDLGGELERIAPDAGLLLSSFQETYSYTLSELFVAAVPPVATRLGAFADRVVDGENGFLFDPNLQSLNGVLNRLVDDDAALESVRTRLRAHSDVRTVQQMVADYDQVLPKGPLPTARFRVEVGARTALLADYQHLSSAYAQLSQAYKNVQQAYEQTAAAYEKTMEAFRKSHDQAHFLSEESLWIRSRGRRFAEEFTALNLPSRWWRARQAQELLNAFRADIEERNTRQAGPHQDGES
ncbi:MAG: hypothetical protein JNM76_14290 [Betaproteobacteria bacterium]|nr:hypothetical protein [Betaproteobacteria bacterium]